MRWRPSYAESWTGSLPEAGGGAFADLITFVKDRPGHDFRYAIDFSRIRKELGWTPAESFETGMEKTVKWNMENREWAKNAVKTL
ncbi:hypothetical protein EPICR_10018 [Candidatus Desulfarcum epimagneticum]|uniref:NAD(P)-binding domain-containing protein n=1 Tax=uncultured Desulfobacteraceae bacterium TaxID=218296 RepID=A0A484HDL5_9BACT|nr:hypothetical protein EPICR_10018 [uncultured Desulfobacteraceae bacterium]